MPRPKYDGVIEAARYAPDGHLDWVRIYERRGPTFSDRVLLDRPTLVERLKAGKKIFSGRRVPFLSSTFELGHPLRLVQHNSAETIVSGDQPAMNRDHLEGVPVV
jgi:hypothetical protein